MGNLLPILRKFLALNGLTGSKEKAEMQKEIANLKSRIEVLEQIVTDEKYDLKKQFKDLEKDKVA